MSISKNGRLTMALACMITLSAEAAFAGDSQRNMAAYPGATTSQSGAGVRAEFVIPLSPPSSSRHADSWRFQLSAGPQRSLRSPNNVRQQLFSPLFQISLRSKHSNTFSFAGRNIFQSWNRSVSAAERAASATDGGGSDITSGGWVAIAVGAGALAGGLLLLSDSDSCDSLAIGCDPTQGPCLPTPC